MHVLLNTDNHIVGDLNLTAYVESVLNESLGYLGERLTRVEVHVTDENSRAKSNGDDKRCMMEARVAGRPPIVVHHQGATIEQAVEGAVEKLERTIDRKLGRLQDGKGQVSMSGDEEANA